MSANSWYVDSLYRRLHASVREIRRVASKDHPGELPGYTYEALEVIAKSVVRRLNGFRHDRDKIRNLALEVLRLGDVFSRVDRVDSTRIPFELLPAVTWAAEAIVGQTKRYRFLIRLSDTEGFSITTFSDLLGAGDMAHPWINDWRKILKDSTSDRVGEVVIIGLPSADARSILLQSLVAHELGHLVIRDLEQREAVLLGEVDKALEGIQMGLRTKVKSLLLNLEGSAVRRSAPAYSGWLSEVFADMTAARLLGPTYLAAAARVFLGRDALPTTLHPSRTFRYKVARYYLETHYPSIWAHEHFSPIVQGIVEEIDVSDGVFEGTSASDTDKESHEAAEQVCTRLFPAIAARVNEAILVNPMQDSDAYVQSLRTIQEHFYHLAPPGRMVPGSHDALGGDTVVFWKILAAGWCFRYDRDTFDKWRKKYKWFSQNEEDNGLQAESRLDNLLLHSLRSAELQSRSALEEV